ncbi:LOW QUALITY PROTEIN: G protein-coupled receptor 88, partial [Salvelinus alpinus]
NANISLAAVYSLVCLFGTILNLLVVYLVVTFKKLRTASNAFIVNGCIVDLLVCAFWMPHEAVEISAGSSFPAVYQAFTDALLFLGITVSLLSHSLIAVNRYVAGDLVINTYLSIYQKRYTEWMLIPSWLLLPWITSSRYPQEGCSCLPASAASVLKGGTPILSDPFEAGTLVLTIVGQTMVVLYCYLKIFRRVQISVKRLSILHFPIVNNLPYSLPHYYTLHYTLHYRPFWVLLPALFTTVPLALRKCSWMIFCTIFVTNPFFYTWKNEEFRKDPCSWENFAVGEPITMNIS